MFKIKSIFAFSLVTVCSQAEENFIVIDSSSDKTIFTKGTGIKERITPCFSFKIALSLMGFDSEILHDEEIHAGFFKKDMMIFLKIEKNPIPLLLGSKIRVSGTLVF